MADTGYSWQMGSDGMHHYLPNPTTSSGSSASSTTTKTTTPAAATTTTSSPSSGSSSSGGSSGTTTVNYTTRWPQSRISNITGFYRVNGSNTVYAIGTGGGPIESEEELAWLSEKTGKKLTSAQVEVISPEKAVSVGIQVPGYTATSSGSTTNTAANADSSATAVTPSTTDTNAAATTLGNLKDDNGTIIDRTTGKEYSTPAELAADLGVSEDSIDWSNISSSVIPDSVALSESFQNLTAEDKSYLAEYYKLLKENDAEKQKIMTDALNQAKEQADPYFREKITMIQDELDRSVGSQKADFASTKKTLEDRISQIQEDLSTNVGRLTLDQQVELRQQEQNYQDELDTLREQASQAGLTFSSRRALAEDRLNTSNTDYVESTKRSYQRQIEDLQKAAARGDTEAKQQLADYERKYGENVTTLVRSAESQLGSSNVNSTYDPYKLGSVTGSIAEEKTADILERANALANLNNPFLS